VTHRRLRTPNGNHLHDRAPDNGPAAPLDPAAHKGCIKNVLAGTAGIPFLVIAKHRAPGPALGSPVSGSVEASGHSKPAWAGRDSTISIHHEECSSVDSDAGCR